VVSSLLYIPMSLIAAKAQLQNACDQIADAFVRCRTSQACHVSRGQAAMSMSERSLERLSGLQGQTCSLTRARRKLPAIQLNRQRPMSATALCVGARLTQPQCAETMASRRRVHHLAGHRRADWIDRMSYLADCLASYFFASWCP